MIRARTAAGNAAYWLVPPLFCLLIHWAAFTAWFRADDFAWLSLAKTVHSFHDLLMALFAPQAQGTIRPWSERAFFMVGYTLFGLDAWPYRVVIFATQFANLALVAGLGARLTGRRAAGFAAAIFWTVSTSAVQPLAWACVYNQVLCGFCLLLAFHFLLRHVETGARRYYIYQWIVFVLGFGVLEVNLVYPGLAVMYALLCARRYLVKSLALVPVSMAYFVLHSIVAPVSKSGVYGVHLDFSILRTLGVYWTWSVGPAYLATPFRVRRWMLVAAIALVSLALAVFLWRQLRQRKLVAAFFLLWFPIVLAPELPLRDHLTEYYPFLPLIGICWLAGWGVAAAWRSGVWARGAATVLVLLYGLLVTPQTVVASRWNRDLTVRSRNLVEGVAGARQAHPSQTILLYGVDGALFWNAVYPSAFRLVGIDHVYLAPGSDRQLADHAEWGDPAAYVLSGAVTSNALDRDQLAVYDVRGARLRNITSIYADLPREHDLPLVIDPGNPLVAEFLGPEWYGIDTDHRWMPRRATLRMGGPVRAGQKLYLRGNCTREQVEGGPLTVAVTVDGVTLPAAVITSSSFELAFPIRDSLVLKAEIQVAIEVSRCFRPAGEVRDLGLAFGEIAVR